MPVTVRASTSSELEPKLADGAWPSPDWKVCVLCALPCLILGAFPWMWTAFSVSAPAALWTPDIARAFAICESENESCVAWNVSRSIIEPGFTLPKSSGPPPPPLPPQAPLLGRREVGERPAVLRQLDRPGGRHVRPDAGERAQHLRLGAVEARRERTHGDHEGHADGQPER